MSEFALVHLAILVTIWLRYGVFAGAVHALVRGLPEERVPAVRLAARTPAEKTVWRETRTSLLVAVIYAAPASVLVYLVLHDAYFYWTHHPRLYERVHHTRHLAKQPTAFASFSFWPLESAVAAWFVPALTFVISSMRARSRSCSPRR